MQRLSLTSGGIRLVGQSVQGLAFEPLPLQALELERRWRAFRSEMLGGIMQASATKGFRKFA